MQNQVLHKDKNTQDESTEQDKLAGAEGTAAHLKAVERLVLVVLDLLRTHQYWTESVFSNQFKSSCSFKKQTFESLV